MSHAMLLGCYTTIKVAIFLHASSLQLNLVNCSAYAHSQPLKPKGHAFSWRGQSGTYSRALSSSSASPGAVSPAATHSHTSTGAGSPAEQCAVFEMPIWFALVATSFRNLR